MTRGTSTLGQVFASFARSLDGTSILVAMLLVQCALLAYLWASYPNAHAYRLQSPYDASQDLKPGDPAPELKVEPVDGNGREIDLPRQHVRSGRHSPLVVVFEDPCAACTEEELREKLRTLKHLSRTARLAVVMPSIPLEIETEFRRSRLSRSLFREANREAQRLYNVAWRPRLFLVNDQGKIVYIQPFRRTLQQAAADVQHMLARDRRVRLAQQGRR